MKIPGQHRKAISPIVATVLIVAATLIAAAAIIGYVFGVFGSSSSTANIAVTSVSFTHGTVNALTDTLTLTNTGTGATNPTSVFLTYQGVSCTLSSLNQVSGGTTVPVSAIVGGASEVLGLGSWCTGSGSITPNAGSTFNGYVILSNGEQASFTGSFS